ncbi:flagellar biosynthetic protein FliR [Lysobacter alkalisoli]|uniref:Flagellar biosynthetic protein FliR n=2 Tax=Marilutibacter alkalisoli TaxID=2591633 RepID=A0A514BT15_9GAMM|nr:flagellar biosynthetic protein FliR [Lysobacter alkalisoli]
MDVIEHFAGLLVLAFLRYLPPVVLPGLTPLRWSPPLVRIVLALGLAWLTVLATPLDVDPLVHQHAMAWVVAAAVELSIGFAFGLVILVPQAALHMSGWLIDVQAGLGAASLFNPGSQGEMQSMLGTALLLLATVLFFTLDLHLDLYRALVASTHVLPLGGAGVRLDLAAFLGLIGSSFLLALMLVAPVLLGLFAVDVGVAYATRSMPQANIYFLMLPLKISMALLLLAATLPFVPFLLERLYRDAFARAPALLGA